MPPSVLNPLCTYEQVHMVPVHSVPRVYREGQGAHFFCCGIKSHLQDTCKYPEYGYKTLMEDQESFYVSPHHSLGSSDFPESGKMWDRILEQVAMPSFRESS